MSDESLLVFASKRSPGLWVNLQSRQESTMDGHRYRHVLCRTGHSNNLEDALVEDSALTRSCCIASLQFVLKLPLKTFLILTFLSKSNKKHTRTRTCQRAFSGSSLAGGSGKKYVTHHFSPFIIKTTKEQRTTFPGFLIPLFIFVFILNGKTSIGTINYLPVWIFFTIYLVGICGLWLWINLYLNKHRLQDNVQFSWLFNLVQTEHMFSTHIILYWFSRFTNIFWSSRIISGICQLFVNWLEFDCKIAIRLLPTWVIHGNICIN